MKLYFKCLMVVMSLVVAALAKPSVDGTSIVRPARTSPNLLVIVVDDMSYDQLAAEGAWFTRAYATSPYCATSRAFIFTGRMISAHKRANNHIHPCKLEPYLVRPFKEQGYKLVNSLK